MGRTGSKIMKANYESPFAIPDDAEVFLSLMPDIQNERKIKVKKKIIKN